MISNNKRNWEKEKVKAIADYSDEKILLVEKFPVKEAYKITTLRIDSFCFLMNLTQEIEVEINEKRYMVKRGESIILIPNMRIRLLNYNAECSCCLLSMSIHFIKESFFNEREMMEQIMQVMWNPIQPEDTELYENISTYRELLYRLTTSEIANRFREQSVQNLIKSCLYESLGYIFKSIPQSNRPKITSGERFFHKFIILLSSMDYTERQVSFYANKLYITPKYLGTLCQQISGKTASGWIDEFMTERIRRLLCYSDKSIKEIADELDFPNVSFFGRYVKKHLGKSPINYRQNINNEET